MYSTRSTAVSRRHMHTVIALIICSFMPYPRGVTMFPSTSAGICPENSGLWNGLTLRGGRPSKSSGSAASSTEVTSSSPRRPSAFQGVKKPGQHRDSIRSNISPSRTGNNRQNSRSGPGGTPSTSFPLLVRGLDSLTTDEIADLFGDCGQVLGVQRSSKGKTIAYFGSKLAAAKGNKLNGTSFDDALIRTSRLRPEALPQAAALAASSSSSSAASGSASKAREEYPIVINDVPHDIGEEEVRACCSKVGEVTSLKPDRRRAGAFWVSFSDKKAARIASKKGLSFGAHTSRVVRVKPDFLTTRPDKATASAREEGKEGNEGKGRAPRRTAVILNLPHGVTQAEVHQSMSTCGDIDNVRIAQSNNVEPAPHGATHRTNRTAQEPSSGSGLYGFVTFRTKTGLQKACARELTVRGVSLKVKRASKAESPKAQVRHSGQPPPQHCRTVLIKNLPYKVSEEEVRGLVAACGKVHSVRPLGAMPRKRGQLQSETDKAGRRARFKGMAYVEFEGSAAVSKALKLHGKEFGGRALRVDWAAPSEAFKTSLSSHRTRTRADHRA